MTPLQNPGATRKHRPRPMYRLADGTRVPSVTAVLQIIAKPWLVPWANRLGLQGVDSAKYVEQTAVAGSLTHDWIEHKLTGRTWDSAQLADYSEDEQGQALRAYAGFRQWSRAHVLEPLLIESALISEQLRIGGTIDLYALLDERHALIDFKTSARVYDSHLVQLAAYRALLEESGRQVDEVRVVVLPRDGSAWFEEVETDTSMYLDVFRAARHLHEAHRVLDRERRRQQEQRTRERAAQRTETETRMQ
ncbi:MAG: PD-(D/E)XK nuclease family protein [Gemmatimonadaceae bacterium]|nr:PD-(D/E)XK nuclease family protein [Gemmatimonadaceae bacterium]